MSVDPLASPVGAGWGANVYAFAGNAPVGLVDPWGLSPMTAGEFREYRQDSSARAWERMGKGLADFVDRNAGWIALGVAAVGVAALAVSGPIGWGILTGMAISGGMELGSQVLSKGWSNVDWKDVAKSASIGGIAGGLGAGAAGLATQVSSRFFGSGVNAVLGHASQFGQRFGLSGGSQMVGAYVEAGMDSMLTYITDGHRVSAGGLAQSWGIPAVSNVLVPGSFSKGFDGAFQKLGWDAVSGVLAKGRSVVSDAVGNFANGFVTYSGAPTTYSPQFESYRDEDYEGPGWSIGKAVEGGAEEILKGGVSSSRPVESLKSVSFGASSGSGGVNYADVVRDISLAGTGAAGGLTSVGKVIVDESVRSNASE